MSGEGPLPANIQKMMNALPPSARQALELAIDKAREQGKLDSIYAMLEQQFKAPEPEPFRMPELSRLFFRPLEKFLVDERPSHKTKGRIWRGALQPVWSWIAHQVAPDEVNSLRQQLQELNGKLASMDDPALRKIEAGLRQSVLPAFEEQLNRARQTPETRRRFASHLGGDYQVQEAEDICAFLKYAGVIEACEKTLPASLSHLVPADVGAVSKIFVRLAALNPHLPYYAAALLQRRIEQPAHLPFWATACAGSDDLQQIAASPFAALIDLSLGDAARMAELCIGDLTKPSEQNRAAVYVRNYAIICRNLRAAVDFDSQSSEWLQRLSEVRLRVSNTLAQELGEMFQLMRRNVRPLRAFGGQAPHPPDDFDIARLCFLVSILGTVRTNAQEFALNELVGRIYGECDGYLQLAIDSLQEELRAGPGPKQHITMAYADAAVRVSRAWHGDEHAAIIKRSFDTAAASAAKKAEDKASA